MFEGGDGTGKTTHRERIANILESRGYEVICVREPGGTKIGEELRDILLDPANKQMSAECELLLYVAARAQIIREVVIPSLERGALVLCDRFIMSTLAYQGYGRGLDKNFIHAANEFATAGVKPDCTFLLQCGGADIALARALEAGEAGEADDMQNESGVHVAQNSHASQDFEGLAGSQNSQNSKCQATREHISRALATADRIESAGQSFHECVSNAYFEIAQNMSSKNGEKESIYIIDTSQEKDEVTKQILELIDKMLQQLNYEPR